MRRHGDFQRCLVKINTNGALNEATEDGGIGYLIRDANGKRWYTVRTNCSKSSISTILRACRYEECNTIYVEHATPA